MMKAYNISTYILDMPYHGLGGTADGDDNVYSFFSSLDMNDDETRRRVIAKFIVPYCKTYSDEILDLLKVAMGYLIKKRDFGFLERALDSCLTVLHLPDDPGKFFVEVWEAIFSQPFHFDEDVKVNFNNEIVNPHFKDPEIANFIGANQTWTLEDDYGL